MLLYNVKKNIENGHILRKEGDLNGAQKREKSKIVSTERTVASYKRRRLG